jgi:hypothetical protein
MHENDGPDRRLEERLRRGMRPGGLSPAQRQRHLDRINARGAWEMDFIRQRSFAELGVVVAVLLVVAAVGIWQSGIFGDETSSEPTALANTGVAPVTSTTSAVYPTATTTESGTSCDVTPFSASGPAEYPAEPVHANWYEGSRIWASPPDMNALNPTLPDTAHFWFSETLPVMWFVEAHDIPTVSANHLTNPDATFSYDFQLPYEHWRAHSLLEFSEPGCWEVHAKSSDGEITFTIDVQPFDDRPDVIYQWQQWQVSSPVGVPSYCGVTNWVLEDRTHSLFAQFWFDGDGISASSLTGLFWAGQDNQVFWIEEDGSTDIVLTGRLQGNPEVEMDVASSFLVVTTDTSQNQKLDTRLVFPEPGCWTIQAESPTRSAEFVVYVYPDGMQ